MPVKDRVNLYVEPNDWEYLGNLAKAVGKNRSEVVRDIISIFTANIRRTLGEDLKAGKVAVSEFYRVMLESGKALGKAETYNRPETRSMVRSTFIAGERQKEG